MPSNTPNTVEKDWIGPPDKVSNIRPYKFYQSENETELERQFREQRTEVLEYNHDFWYKHNKNFFTQKEEFVRKRLAVKKEQAGEGQHDNKHETLSPEEMSEFYKKFLDENYQQHVQYNKTWYKKNISLLWPAAKVVLAKLFKKRQKGKDG